MWRRLRGPGPTKVGDGADSDSDVFAELHELFALELGASTSLNARGTTLAGLVGATIALVANFADAWKDRLGGERQWLEVFFGASLIALALAALFALWAIWPASKWRQDFLNLQRDVAAGKPRRAQAEHMLHMTDKQRRKNEDKAMLMRLAYLSLGVAVLAIGAQAAVFAL